MLKYLTFVMFIIMHNFSYWIWKNCHLVLKKPREEEKLQVLKEILFILLMQDKIQSNSYVEVKISLLKAFYILVNFVSLQFQQGVGKNQIKIVINYKIAKTQIKPTISVCPVVQLTCKQLSKILHHYSYLNCRSWLDLQWKV